MDGYACDPRSLECNATHRCSVCELFGCQGHQGKFRLEIAGSFDLEEKKGSVRCKDSSHNFRLFIPPGATSGDFMLKFIPLRSISTEEDVLLKLTLRIMIEMAAIGARNQMGYGIVDYFDTAERTKLHIQSRPQLSGKQNSILHPALSDFVFGSVVVHSGSTDETVELKCQLRDAFRRPFGSLTRADDLTHFRHFLVGTLQTVRTCPICLGNSFVPDKFDQEKFFCHVDNKAFGRLQVVSFDKMASKLFVSRPIPDGQAYRLRFWGWIPSRLPFNQKRADVITHIASSISPCITYQAQDLGSLLAELGVPA